VIKYGEVWGTVSRTLKSHPAIKTDSLFDATIARQQDFSIKVRKKEEKKGKKLCNKAKAKKQLLLIPPFLLLCCVY